MFQKKKIRHSNVNQTTVHKVVFDNFHLGQKKSAVNGISISVEE